MTLRELKQGALLHVLIALLIYGPGTKDDLRRRTGWSAEAVADALDVLTRAPYQLVAAYPGGRWPMWAPTAQAEQLFHSLGKVSPLPADSNGGGSSYLIKNQEVESSLLLPVSPRPADSNHPPVDNSVENPLSGQLVINQLTSAGCPPKRACSVINAALKRGERPADIAQRITHLRQWVQHQRFQIPGEVIAQYIESGAELPNLPPATDGTRDYSGYRRLLAGEEGDDG